ncbi:MAG: ribosome silencing factor [Cohaesibacteraceae bacterium]|nr:ribosome silencing factor [Cohaesibacteraceae bacterium]
MQPENTETTGVVSLELNQARMAPDGALNIILESLEDSKAEHIINIDMVGKSALADNMVIASGRSNRHVGASADRLLRDLKDRGFATSDVEGLPACDWVLIDAGDVIVHLFRPEVREFYNIEKMWSVDAPKIPDA